MIQTLFLSLPIFLLMLLYIWAMVSTHGVAQGLQVSSLAISFSFISTPLLSYLFVFGCIPRFIINSFNSFGVFVIWSCCIGINLFTLTYFPKIYTNWPITKIAYETLMTGFTRNTTLAISLGSLCYHWTISRLQGRMLKLWLHIFGLVISGTLFYLIIPSIRDVLIIVFNAGNENF